MKLNKNFGLFILWLLIGIVVLFFSEKVTKLQYFLVWFLLILDYFYDWLKDNLK